MNATISRSIFKFDEQKEKLESDYYRHIEGESGHFFYHFKKIEKLYYKSYIH